MPSSTSTKTGTSPLRTIGLTVVGKPAATVITSSPGCRRRSPSFFEVRAETASRFADEPELHRSACRTPTARANSQLELLRVAAGREPEVERRVDEVEQLVGVEDTTGDRDRRLAGDELAGRELERRGTCSRARGSARAARPPSALRCARSPLRAVPAKVLRVPRDRLVEPDWRGRAAGASRAPCAPSPQRAPARGSRRRRCRARPARATPSPSARRWRRRARGP